MDWQNFTSWILCHSISIKLWFVWWWVNMDPLNSRIVCTTALDCSLLNYMKRILHPMLLMQALWAPWIWPHYKLGNSGLGYSLYSFSSKNLWEACTHAFFHSSCSFPWSQLEKSFVGDFPKMQNTHFTGIQVHFVVGFKRQRTCGSWICYWIGTILEGQPKYSRNE